MIEAPFIMRFYLAVVPCPDVAGYIAECVSACPGERAVC